MTISIDSDRVDAVLASLRSTGATLSMPAPAARASTSSVAAAFDRALASVDLAAHSAMNATSRAVIALSDSVAGAAEDLANLDEAAADVLRRLDAESPTPLITMPRGMM
ncbi:MULTISPECIES: hypothetical protein [unclassified Microbacterium]|uniref:hypothetical protein n=1 Tax=unclassified Microbacterium TaxID=2609290 RepID=UPI003466A41B